jgi:hypothetical protein
MFKPHPPRGLHRPMTVFGEAPEVIIDSAGNLQSHRSTQRRL